MTKPSAEPRVWFAVISKTRQEGTIGLRDRRVQYEQNVEHLCLVEEAAYARLKKQNEVLRVALMNICLPQLDNDGEPLGDAEALDVIGEIAADALAEAEGVG